MGSPELDPQTLNLGLLLVRIVVGLFMAAHGAQKLLGWFGGYGLKGTGEFMVQLGFPSGPMFATAAALGEIVSGILIVLGFLGPVGPALLISVMIVAMITVHWDNGLFATNNGVELPLLYAIVALGLGLTGYGSYSLDSVAGIAGRWSVTITVVVLVIGAVGGFANVAIRKRPGGATGA